ncbi:histone H1-beta, late embryonic-like [Penaeus indicus]|uniref:histone H1-beta, late embryonic-like n=1 Tax=Penaeus indicus TaxID=29960 RepID=UPI00300D2ECD
MEAGKLSSDEPMSPSASSSSPKAAAQDAPRPTYLAMILEAVLALGDRRGSSRQSIAKYIAYQFGLDAKKSTRRVNQALKAALEKGLLRQVSGSGVVGSFKLGHMDMPVATVTRKLLGKPSPQKTVGKSTKKQPAAKAKGKGVAAKAAAKGAAKAAAKKGGAKAAKAKATAKKAAARKSPSKKAAAKKSPSKKAASKSAAKKAGQKAQEKKAAKESPARKAKGMAKKPIPKKAKKP